jgi:hypothetical protein
MIKLEGVHFDDDGGGDWSYVSTRPWLETGPDGRPTATLLMVGDQAMFQAGIRLDPPAVVLERCRDAIAGRADGAVRLRPGVARVDRIGLLVSDGDGPFAELASSKGSGMPPFQAVFNVQLDATAASAVRAALDGRRGRVHVHLEGALRDGSPLRLRADLAALDTPLPAPGASRGDLRRSASAPPS